jgi:hypothetical protein
MSTTLDTRRPSTTIYAPPGTRDEIIAEAIGCILAGRPLPEQLRPPASHTWRPATSEAAFARILAGPGAGAR